MVIPQINTDTTLNVRNNPTVNRLKAILENGPVRGIHSVVYVESYNSFMKFLRYAIYVLSKLQLRMVTQAESLIKRNR